jgi:hypothetical protein
MTTDRGQPAVRLGRAGAMPLVGLGTWQMTGARCQAAVRVALEVGYRHLDTATIYRTEREVGRGPELTREFREPPAGKTLALRLASAAGSSQGRQTGSDPVRLSRMPVA